MSPYKTLLLIVFCLTSIGQAYLYSNTIQATAISRAAAKEGDEYTPGLAGIGRANVGFKENTEWKTFIIFDAISAVDDLVQNPQAKLQIQVSWIKDPAAVKPLHVKFVGAFNSAEITDANLWPKFQKQSTHVGTIPVAEIAGLTQGKDFTFDLNQVIPSGAVTPSNRFLYFRFESEPVDDSTKNGMIGLAKDLSKSQLIIGGESDADSGGYL